MKHFGKALEYYGHSISHRRQWTDFWFRLLAVAVGGFALFFAWDFLERNYSTLVSIGGKVVLLNQILFAWFFAGVVFGAAFIVLVSEGEILMGFRKIAKATAEGATQSAEKPKARPKAGKGRQ